MMKSVESPVLFVFILALGIFIGLFLAKNIKAFLATYEGFESQDPNSDFRSQRGYKMQLASVLTRFSGVGGRRLGYESSPDLLKDDENCLVNYYVLGCRIAGYLGPFQNGYLDPGQAIAIASQAGCRVFVLDIDYMGKPENAYPRLVVRDKQNKSVAEAVSNGSFQQTDRTSNLLDAIVAIKANAVESSMNQSKDPLILVLNFLRIPGTSAASNVVLDYYSAVARNLEPLHQYFLHNEPSGTYHRQSQEGKILTNPITAFDGKVLLFTNADTTGFRQAPAGKYTAKEDLDYLVNLRLYYNQSKIGVTQPTQGQVFGIMEKVGDYTVIPSDRKDQIVERLKLQWTLALPNDPAVSTDQETFTVAKSYGVNCVPIAIWDEAAVNDYIFNAKNGFFRAYSYIPKPPELRYRKPKAVVPATPSTQLDSKGGSLRSPV